jgi:cytochrome c peroxidase
MVLTYSFAVFRTWTKTWTLKNIGIPLLCMAVYLYACTHTGPPLPPSPPGHTALDSLGRHLFFDTRLSANGTKSCATCHDPAFAFTDGYRQSTGLYGDPLRRNAPTLLNTRYLPTLGWADPSVRTYEQQMLKPFFNTNPRELGISVDSIGLGGHFGSAVDMHTLLDRFRDDTLYMGLFRRAFPRAEGLFGPEHLFAALAAYERTLVSFDAPYDWQERGTGRLGAAAARGKSLFFSRKLRCSSCHTPPLFTDGQMHRVDWHGEGGGDIGVFEVTGRSSDQYKFRTPTLRNVALTAPYLHDGSVANLAALLDTFAQRGHGRSGQPIRLASNQRRDLLLFLESLTDSTIFQNPWFR